MKILIIIFICFFMEKNHKMKQQNFSDFFEGSSEGIIITDEKTDIVYYNSIILEMLPNISKTPTKKDFNSVINLDCIFDEEISYNLFDLDHLVLTTKKRVSVDKKKYFLFRIKTSDKDSVERRLSFFLNNIDEIVYTEKIVKNKRENIGFISKGIEKITGVSSEDMIIQNKLPYEFSSEIDKTRILEFLKNIKNSREPEKCQFRIQNQRKKFNTWVELSIYPQISKKDHHFANFGVIRDISKDIEADQLLRQSELKHRLLFSEANDAIMIFKDIEMVDCNEKTLSMFNASGFLEIAGKKLYELMPEKQPSGDDSILNYHYHMQSALDGESQFFYWRHSKLDGEQFDCEVSINSFTVESDSYVQVIVRDITQRKIAEEQKNQSIKSYFEIFNSSSDLIFIVDSQGIVIDVNQTVLNTYKILKESIVGSSFDHLGELIIINDDDLIKIGKAWSGEPQKFEWHCTPNHGDRIPLEMILHPGTYFGKEVIIASGRNISERLKYERTMKESESRFRTLASHAPIGIFLTNKGGDAVYVNNKLKEIAHYPSVDGFMENWLSKIHPKDQKRIKSHIDITQKDNHQQYEYRIVPKKGNERWVKVQVNLLRDSNNEITGRVGTIEDITQEIISAKMAKDAEKDKLRAEFAEEAARKLQKEIDERIAAEDELKSAKELNQYIIDSSTDMIIATDIKGNITEFNKAATEGFGYNTSNIIDSPVAPLFAKELNREEILVNVLKKGKWSGEVLCKRADCSTFMGYLSASILSGPEKKAMGTMGVLRDITELKKAEAELKNNIHQKEILLKEVHHRVKNNLQVISSILNLQTGYINDEDTLGVIRECQDRIKSMAFIHESLYQKEDFAAVNFSEYLHNLCSNILYSYMTPNRNIKFDFHIEDISLSLDSAIPCGLIVNELVSNCFKYAFEDLKQGNIKVTLTRDKDNNKCLTVHDSGKGLPQNLNIKTNDSLGLQLVWMLVDQIDGEIKYEYASGSKFIVNFKRD